MATTKSKSKRSTSSGKKSNRKSTASKARAGSSPKNTNSNRTARTTSNSADSRGQASKSSNTRQQTAQGRKTKKGGDGSMLQEFFLHALKDIYWAENELTKALPKMEEEATSKELKKAFRQHLEVTKKQIGRLDQVFQKLGEKAEGKKCDAMKGLIDESESIISETEDDTSTRDAALIITAQKVEHYEIATYGGLAQLAKTMRKPEIAKLLEATLAEEKETDVQLTKLAEQGGVNVDASKEEATEDKKGIKEKIMAILP
jgi:ferritin-like metal-binding protein YciE